MLYLLDANTLIDAKRDYFQFRRVPEFWEWIHQQGEVGNVKVPFEIYEEFEETRRPDGSRDELSEWAAKPQIKDALLLHEEPDPALVAEVTARGYAVDLTDNEVEKVGRDPFLVAYAYADIANRTVVSTEVSKPTTQRANRRVPDVCRTLSVRCIHNFNLLNELDFSTGWRG